MRAWLLTGAVALVAVVGGTVYLATTGGGTTSPTAASGIGTVTRTPLSTADKRAQDRATQSKLRNAMVAEKVFYTDSRRYTKQLPELSKIEPSVEWDIGIAGPAAAPGTVYVEVPMNAQIACLTARSESGELFMIKDVATGTLAGISYARGTRLPGCDEKRLDASW